MTIPIHIGNNWLRVRGAKLERIFAPCSRATKDED
jgi:hypothetical protein